MLPSVPEKVQYLIMNLKRVPARFYKTSGGNEPVREWLKQLGALERKIVGTDIKTVEYGWPMGMPTCRSMGKGLYEVRSSLPNGKISRVLFLYLWGRNDLVTRIYQEDSENAKTRF
jgi:phage-related protein